jgi:poly-gamma-glutamate synthesis protein (capsule biosynthesis protein)
MSNSIGWLGAIGDIFVNRDRPETTLDDARPLIDEIDIFFGNCEGVFTDTDDIAPSCGFRVAAPMRNMVAIETAGFDVLALANNHMVDAGHAAFTTMLDRLRAMDITCIGAGRTLAEARAPAISTIGTTRVGFLSYTMIYQAGYQARAHVPGVSALRVHSVPYFPDWDPYGRIEPGAQPHVRTFPYPEDVRLLEGQIKALKTDVDIVIVSMHWGDSRLPVVLTDYEKAFGHAAIDAGADAILGHHHHFLKALEFYSGKPIFYGLGHFAFDLLGLEAVVGPEDIRRLDQFSPWAIYPRADTPGYPFHHDTRYTGFALLGIADGRIQEVRFAPFYITLANETRPSPLDGGQQDAAAYLKSVTLDVGFGTQFIDAESIGGIPTVLCLPPETASTP